MRLTYASLPLPPLTAVEDATVRQALERRGATGLVALDQALLHSLPLMQGWNDFFRAIQKDTEVPRALHTLAICRVALQNQAWYQWSAHFARLSAMTEFTDGKIAVVKDPNPTERGDLTRQEWIVLRYADTMTKSVHVGDAMFDELKSISGLKTKGIVELTGTISAYNCVSRFLIALDVGEMNDEQPAELS
jgi:alkylhydroperoxidase family enzyme